MSDVPFRAMVQDGIVGAWDQPDLDGNRPTWKAPQHPGTVNREFKKLMEAKIHLFVLEWYIYLEPK